MSRFKHNIGYLITAQNMDPSTVAVYTDGEYTVEKHDIGIKPFDCRLVIKRMDGEPFRSWRLLQDIKNEVVGADRTAIEIYPPEDEVTDTANIYHLWVFMEGLGPNVRLIPPQK
jgi:hypothetical protein